MIPNGVAPEWIRATPLFRIDVRAGAVVEFGSVGRRQGRGVEGVVRLGGGNPHASTAREQVPQFRHHGDAYPHRPAVADPNGPFEFETLFSIPGENDESKAAGEDEFPVLRQFVSLRNHLADFGRHRLRRRRPVEQEQAEREPPLDFAVRLAFPEANEKVRNSSQSA